jgi:predicted TIM-barrel fold metal-dependent hydrolase
MFRGHPVIDSDSHKCENPLVLCDFIPAPFRGRFAVFRDRWGEQRFRILDRDPATGASDLVRIFPQPEGYGKGTYRPYHEETTLGGLFNRVRLAHMDREGIDHQVIYGSVTLAFGSLVDPELAAALCRAYNDYIHQDCRGQANRLHPMAVLPLQDPTEAVREMRRCVEELGLPGVTLAPHLPRPHPAAPERFPELRVPKPLSHPDFLPIFEEAQRLDVAVGLHGAPGMGLAAGAADQLDTFTLVHVFANRTLQQTAIARLVFDGVMERFPRLRFGFLEAGAGWAPDFFHALHEHWKKRVANFDPDLEPPVAEFLLELARERNASGDLGLMRKAGHLMGLLFQRCEGEASREEVRAFRYEHPNLPRDPLEYLERGQIFLTVEPDDPAPVHLPAALGAAGRRLCGMAVDYGHWDATLRGCVQLVADRPGIDPDYAVRLLSTNALDFYGERLRRRIGLAAAATAPEDRMQQRPLCPVTTTSPRRFDPFRSLSQEERRRHLDAYQSHLEARNGALDLPSRTLSRRERYFAELELRPVSWRGEIDREGFFARFHGTGTPPIDPRTLWLVAIAKANEGESYGVEQELKRLIARGSAGMDARMLHVFLEEQYHSRILVEACRTCGLDVKFQRPSWQSRWFIAAIYYLPERMRWTLILSGEVLGTTIFKLLLDHCHLFAEEPAVEQRLHSLLSEIWHDEALHVAYLRALLGPLALRTARRLLPLVVRNVMAEVPQLVELGCDQAELMARMHRGLELPPGLEWIEPEPARSGRAVGPEPTHPGEDRGAAPFEAQVPDRG